MQANSYKHQQQRARLALTPWPAGSTCSRKREHSFVETRLVAQAISPKRPNPPVKGLDRFVVPSGVSLDWLVEQAWDWRNSDATPELENGNVRFPRESELQEMEKHAPWVAAIARQQAEAGRAFIKRTKLTHTIARIQQLIVDQHGWPEQA